MPPDKRKQLTSPREVTISAAELQKMLADIPDAKRVRKRQFNAREDSIILAGWDTKTKAGIAEFLGISVNTMRRRHYELMKERR